MPHVIRYNAKKPTKFASFPKYSHFVADERYAEIARILGLPARTTEEGVTSLINAIRDMNKNSASKNPSRLLVLILRTSNPV